MLAFLLWYLIKFTKEKTQFDLITSTSSASHLFCHYITIKKEIKWLKFEVAGVLAFLPLNDHYIELLSFQEITSMSNKNDVNVSKQAMI